METTMTDDDYKPTPFGVLLVAAELKRRGHDPETIMEKAQEICERNNQEAAEQEQRERAERNILEKMKHIWQHYEFDLFLQLDENVADEKIVFTNKPTDLEYAGHITASELRAAFGRDNPLIAEFEKGDG
jgi:hypothetical protein